MYNEVGGSGGARVIKTNGGENRQQWSGQWRDSPRGFLMLLKAGASSSDPSAEYEKTNKQKLKKPKRLHARRRGPYGRHPIASDHQICLRPVNFRNQNEQKRIRFKINHCTTETMRLMDLDVFLGRP